MRRRLSGFSLVAWVSAICHEAAVPELEAGGANLNTVLSLKQGCHLSLQTGKKGPETLIRLRGDPTLVEQPSQVLTVEAECGPGLSVSFSPLSP